MTTHNARIRFSIFHPLNKVVSGGASVRLCKLGTSDGNYGHGTLIADPIYATRTSTTPLLNPRTLASGTYIFEVWADSPGTDLTDGFVDVEIKHSDGRQESDTVPFGTSGSGGGTGPPGTPGTVFRSGSGAPSNSLGIDGDYYLNTTNGDVYLRASGTYSVQGNIQGSQGVQGDPGPPGADGTAATITHAALKVHDPGNWDTQLLPILRVSKYGLDPGDVGYTAGVAGREGYDLRTPAAAVAELVARYGGTGTILHRPSALAYTPDETFSLTAPLDVSGHRIQIIGPGGKDYQGNAWVAPANRRVGVLYKNGGGFPAGSPLIEITGTAHRIEGLGISNSAGIGIRAGAGSNQGILCDILNNVITECDGAGVNILGASVDGILLWGNFINYNQYGVLCETAGGSNTNGVQILRNKIVWNGQPFNTGTGKFAGDNILIKGTDSYSPSAIWIAGNFFYGPTALHLRGAKGVTFGPANYLELAATANSGTNIKDRPYVFTEVSGAGAGADFYNVMFQCYGNLFHQSLAATTNGWTANTGQHFHLESMAFCYIWGNDHSTGVFTDLTTQNPLCYIAASTRGLEVHMRDVRQQNSPGTRAVSASVAFNRVIGGADTSSSNPQGNWGTYWDDAIPRIRQWGVVPAP